MAADKAGLERVAVRATMVTYGMEYFRGIRAEAGSMSGAVRSLQEFLQKAGAAGEVAAAGAGAAGVPKSMAAVSNLAAAGSLAHQALATVSVASRARERDISDRSSRSSTRLVLLVSDAISSLAVSTGN